MVVMQARSLRRLWRRITAPLLGRPVPIIRPRQPAPAGVPLSILLSCQPGC